MHALPAPPVSLAPPAPTDVSASALQLPALPLKAASSGVNAAAGEGTGEHLPGMHDMQDMQCKAAALERHEVWRFVYDWFSQGSQGGADYADAAAAAAAHTVAGSGGPAAAHGPLMTLSCFNAFANRCRIVCERVGAADVESIFMAVVNSSARGMRKFSKRLAFEDFQDSLLELALKRYPECAAEAGAESAAAGEVEEGGKRGAATAATAAVLRGFGSAEPALLRLHERHVLPLYEKLLAVQPGSRDAAVMHIMEEVSAPPVVAFFATQHGALRKLFRRYSSMMGDVRANAAAKALGYGSLLDGTAFAAFARDFNITPHLISEEELGAGFEDMLNARSSCS